MEIIKINFICFHVTVYQLYLLYIIRLKFSGFTYAEIAGAVGKREDNVRKRMERAKKKLQTIILDREVEENDR